MIQQPITMTSKGTFTLPAHVRKALGVQAKGDKLMLTFHEQSKTVELNKGSDFVAIQAEIAKAIPKNIKNLDINTIREIKHQAYIRDHIA